ncbi:MAG: Asparaginase/glutaminase [Gemmatimonadetes bacterium]|jgi:L-asparaginase|nr:Asparaginase/glutaminase [Gemmatimonadota bacterium]
MIVILFTGGTISMKFDAALGGAVPTLSGHEIVEATRGLADVAALEVEQWGRHPGPHMTVERMWALRNRIAHHLARPEVQGIVVTHGTDTLEESAYMVARSITAGRPVVFTGAMRTASDLGWDGPSNLLEATRVAASPASCGKGVLISLGDRIHSALEVTKTHTEARDAFDSPGLGALGEVDEGVVVYRRGMLDLPSPLLPVEPVHPVDIVYAYAGADGRLVEASVATGARGLVIAAMGRGNVPPAMFDAIARAAGGGLPVIVTSRALLGRVGPTYGYPGGGRRLMEAGAIFAYGRRPGQARIDAMLALGLGYSVAELRELFREG